MGYTNTKQNVEALKIAGGKVEDAVEKLNLVKDNQVVKKNSELVSNQQ